MLPKPKDGIGGARKLTFSLKDLHMSMLKCYRNLRTAYAGQGQLLSRSRFFVHMSMLKCYRNIRRHRRSKDNYVLAEEFVSRVHVEMSPKPKNGMNGGRKLTFSLQVFHVSMLKCYRNLRTAYAVQGNLRSR